MHIEREDIQNIFQHKAERMGNGPKDSPAVLQAELVAAVLLHGGHDRSYAVQLGNLSLIVLVACKIPQRKCTFLLAASVFGKPVDAKQGRRMSVIHE